MICSCIHFLNDCAAGVFLKYVKNIWSYSVRFRLCAFPLAQMVKLVFDSSWNQGWTLSLSTHRCLFFTFSFSKKLFGWEVVHLPVLMSKPNLKFQAFVTLHVLRAWVLGFTILLITAASLVTQIAMKYLCFKL